MPRLTIELMYETAIKAVEHVSAANWERQCPYNQPYSREIAAKRWLWEIRNGHTDADLDRIQREVNDE